MVNPPAPHQSARPLRCIFSIHFATASNTYALSDSHNQRNRPCRHALRHHQARTAGRGDPVLRRVRVACRDLEHPQRRRHHDRHRCWRNCASSAPLVWAAATELSTESRRALSGSPPSPPARTRTAEADRSQTSPGNSVLGQCVAAASDELKRPGILSRRWACRRRLEPGRRAPVCARAALG